MLSHEDLEFIRKMYAEIKQTYPHTYKARLASHGLKPVENIISTQVTKNTLRTLLAYYLKEIKK